MTSNIRFGVVCESVLAGPAWPEHARRIEDLEARRERFGLSYLVTPDRDLPALSKIIASL